MTGDPPDLDRRVRAAFDPAPETVEAVVAAASSDGLARGRRRPLILGLAAAAVVVLTAVGLWRGGPNPVGDPVQVQDLDAWFDDEVLVVPLPDGSVTLVGPGHRADRPPDGVGVAIVMGDDQ
jgi:hypothetical protein